MKPFALSSVEIFGVHQSEIRNINKATGALSNLRSQKYNRFVMRFDLKRHTKLRLGLAQLEQMMLSTSFITVGSFRFCGS